MTKVLTINDISRFSATTVLNDKFMRVKKQLFRVANTVTVLRTNDPEKITLQESYTHTRTN